MALKHCDWSAPQKNLRVSQNLMQPRTHAHTHTQNISRKVVDREEAGGPWSLVLDDWWWRVPSKHLTWIFRSLENLFLAKAAAAGSVQAGRARTLQSLFCPYKRGSRRQSDQSTVSSRFPSVKISPEAELGPDERAANTRVWVSVTVSVVAGHPSRYNRQCHKFVTTLHKLFL